MFLTGLEFPAAHLLARRTEEAGFAPTQKAKLHLTASHDHAFGSWAGVKGFSPPSNRLLP